MFLNLIPTSHANHISNPSHVQDPNSKSYRPRGNAIALEATDNNHPSPELTQAPLSPYSAQLVLE